MKCAKDYHSSPPGKVGTAAKTIRGRDDLAVAYTPGVAEICTMIRDDQQLAYQYTNIRNRVLVVSDGTATLGLGNTGPLGSKPVMEGKVALMSALADIDAVDLVCGSDELVVMTKMVACNFGAINLEDVAAPRCFEVVQELSKQLDIAVFHDDQYGTAVVVAAALQKLLGVVGKRLDGVKIVVAGAGASAQATAELLIYLGACPEQIWMFDSRGLLTDCLSLDQYKQRFAKSGVNDMSYAEALRGADVFVGLSKGDVLRPEDIVGMNAQPIVLALANPVPEVDVVAAKKLRTDGLFATGSSRDPNQVNNVLCFPFLLRGVLDAAAARVSMNMLRACVSALVGIECDGLLPDPFDWRLLFGIAPAVAAAATAEGLAHTPVDDIEGYKWQLLFRRLGLWSRALPGIAFPMALPTIYADDDYDAVAIVEYGKQPRCYATIDCCVDHFGVQGAGAVRCDSAAIAAVVSALKDCGAEYTKYVRVAGKWRLAGGSSCGMLFRGLISIDNTAIYKI